MPSLFTQIIQGKIPCHKIMENDCCFAFLDIKPVKPGHTLVIPKVEIDYFFDLDDTLIGELMVFSKKVAKIIRKAVPCQRIGVMVAGLEIPHAHVHLIPMDHLADLNFANARKASDEELSQMTSKIRACISG